MCYESNPTSYLITEWVLLLSKPIEDLEMIWIFPNFRMTHNYVDLLTSPLPTI